MVPTSGDWIPARLGREDGNDVMKSQLSLPRPSEATVISRTIRVAKPISRLKISTPLNERARHAVPLRGVADEAPAVSGRRGRRPVPTLTRTPRGTCGRAGC